MFVLYDLGEPYLHSHVSLKERGRENLGTDSHRRGEGDVIQPQAKECLQPPDTGKGMVKINCFPFMTQVCGSLLQQPQKDGLIKMD